MEKTNAWNTFKDKFFNVHHYSTRRKFYNSAWSILLGILLVAIIISFFGYNPFQVIWSFIEDSNSLSYIFIPTLATFILAGLSIAICFKSGVFNIGVAGQMMSAGFITLVLIRYDISNSAQGMASHGTVVLSILASIAISTVVALLIGLLKAYLNVNEVVSSIMLNWIIFFMIRYFVGLFQNSSGNGFHLTTGELFGYGRTVGYVPYETLPGFYYIGSWLDSAWSWIIILFTIIITIIIWITIRFTKFGYKVNMVGLSPTAAEYSGTNKKHLILLTMAISGALSGLAGFVWYFSAEQGTIDISISSGPLYVGFNAIAISLIVFNNPIAVIFSSLIFSIVSVGSTTTTSYPVLPNEMIDIISGIFIYSSALAFIFTRFLPYQWARNFFILVRYSQYRKVYWKNYREFFIYHISWFEEKRSLWKLKRTNQEIWKNINKQMDIKQRDEIARLVGRNSKNSLKKLDSKNQILYFELLADIKKQREILLADEHYFDTYKIKMKRKERYSNWKQQFQKMKKSIINEHLNISEEKIVETTNEIIAKEKKKGSN